MAEAPAAEERSRGLPFHLLPWIVFGAVFIGYAAIRANYSYINFNNNGDEAGVEKLFNLSLQQSFLFGEGYPPQWTWLAGEPIRYYIFLKSIPGMAAWIARVAFGNTETGGIFFILSEAFFGALPYGVICGWVMWFGRSAKSSSAVSTIAVALSLFCLVGTHYQALSLGIKALLTHAQLDWWQLSHEVIPFTDNQYPVWLMILGDNHAYMQVYFLQILFWGAFLRLILLREFSSLQAACVGVLAAALVLSHPGSVLVDASVLPFFIAFVGIYFIRRRHWNRVRLAALHGITAAFVTFLFLSILYTPVGTVKIVASPREIASRVLAFLNLNFSILLWAALLCGIPATLREIRGNFRKHIAAESAVIVSAILIILFFFLSLPALCVMALFGCLTYMALYRDGLSETEQILCLFAVSSFSIWLPPEVVAVDHTIDSRTTWIRFQMSLRFWPEGYFLIPFALTLAMIQRIGEKRLSHRWTACACCVLALFFAGHIPGVSNRISRSQQRNAEIDGFAEFDRRYPADGAIVSYLRTLPADNRAVIAESCGFGDPRVPSDFGWPGRIAAYSGRAGICGWARHAVLYNNPLQQTGFKGTSVEEKTSTFLRAYAGFFWNLSDGREEQAFLNLMTLRALGVTHIVYGQFERSLFPKFSIESAVGKLPVTIEFNASNGLGVLRLNE